MQEDFSKYNGQGTSMRKAQMRMLKVLVAIDKVCKTNNIPYWIDSGTLLGAVRHGGFIPWDDDADVCIERKNYKRLRECLVKELPKDIAFTDWTLDRNAPEKLGRVTDKLSDTHYFLFSAQKERGLCVDIFIMEPVIFNLKKMIDKFYGPVFRRAHNFGKVQNISNYKRIIQKFISYILYPFAFGLVLFGRIMAKIVPSKTLLSSTYSSMSLTPHKISSIFPLSTISFEGYTFPAPGNVDEYLTELYGDYMKLPPEKDRINTHINDVEFFDENIC